MKKFALNQESDDDIITQRIIINDALMIPPANGPLERSAVAHVRLG